ncbi:hypothetical protein J8M20_01545 [Pseudoalteromonas luteoviolacea]|uniref:hypothetical protein n=1 Tax=Pseudoalteromonas luteoviolacea TaxID=43657 RepID=UPI001B39C7B4|nr:hypothetical protein [Pseudoalteromonas luteoviolacea]MBQ4809993.1 hypothetical protein [Pseudoalteromonas luteoviolacea]
MHIDNMNDQNIYAVDLRCYECPQLFVQFKWQLKTHKDHADVIRFSYDKQQDLSDVVRYLENSKMNFSVKSDGKINFIEVHSTDV